MDTIQLCIQYIENYNVLIKYKIRAYKGNVADERKIINLHLVDGLPDVEAFKQEVLQILKNEAYPDNFIYSINRMYLLGGTNSDLLAEPTVICWQNIIR